MKEKRLTQKVMLTFCIILLSMFFLTSCSQDNGMAQKEPASQKDTTAQNVPTLEEVISGTWHVYAFFDGGGSMVKISDTDFQGEMSFTFDASDNFTGVIVNEEAGLNSVFSGTYDVSDSKQVSKNPYEWYYYCTIDENSITDSGLFTFITKMGREGLNSIMKFRDVDGELMLYDEIQKWYYKKN